MEYLLISGSPLLTLPLPGGSGLHLQAASSLAEGLDLLSRQSFDGILFDVRLAADRCDQAFKSIHDLTDLPLIALVAGGSRPGKRLYLEGAREVLSLETLTPEYLETVLKAVADGYQRRKEIQNLRREVARLRSYEKPFQSFFDRSPIGMVLLDREGRLLRTNLAMQQMVGYTAEELNDNPLTLFTHPEDALGLLERFHLLMEGKEDYFQVEVRYLSQDGRTALWRLSVSLVRDLQEAPSYAFGIVEDITERRRNEEELKKAKQAAEDSTRTKSDFLANTSHEIRTPIHTITGMTELLMDTQLDEEQQEYAHQIHFSADVLLSLINDILDLSKIEAGKLHLELIDFDLFRMIEDAVDLVTLQAHQKGLEIITYMHPDSPHLLRGDPVRLRQIVINLVNNAVKFTQAGHVLIRGECLEEDESSMVLRITVADTGIGISPEKIGQLFMSFSQGDSSMTRKYGGTGLGLSISKNLAEMMGGRIGVESEEGRGSSFWFTARLSKQKVASLFRDVPVDFFEGREVLLVEDNAEASRACRLYMQEWGFRVTEVASGAEGLVRLREAAEAGRPYQLALVDLRMPGIDGWQFASEVNADRSINNTKLILMTPAGMSGQEAKMKLLKWFDGYLGKPLKKGELLSTLFRVVNSEIDLDSLESEPAEELVEEITEEPAVPKGQARILVAEDHEINQQLFKTILEKSGYRVDLANHGQEAVEAVQRRTYNLIFMDLQMPVLNGLEAARRIRSLGIRVPIVAVTANAAKEEVERCRQAGMNDYLSKPFKKRDLLPMLQKWLEVKESPETGGGAGASGSTEGTEAADSPPAPGGGVPAFDYSQALETFMGRKDVLRKVLAAFIPKVKNQIRKLEDALRRRDFETVRFEAHSIKGGSLNLQALPLGNAARALEEAGREHHAIAAGCALAVLKEAFSRFVVEARRRLEEP